MRKPTDDEVLGIINTVLNANYSSIDNVPDDKLYRAYLLIKLDCLLAEAEEKGIPINVFMCTREDIDEWSNVWPAVNDRKT